MAQFMAAAALVSAGTQVAGGIMKQNAARKEANLLEDQAILIQQEAIQDANIHATRVRKFAADQKSAFMKNGVTLEGSPLLVLEETRKYGQEEVDAIMRSGYAKYRLNKERAAITRSEGRAALISGVGSGVGSLVTRGANGAGAGLFGGNVNSGGAPADVFGMSDAGSPVKISNPYA